MNYHSQIEKGRIVSAGPVIPFEELYGEMVEKNEKWNAETAKLKYVSSWNLETFNFLI